MSRYHDRSSAAARPAGFSRRGFLKGSAAGVAALSFGALVNRTAAAVQLPYSPDYGPLVPANDLTTGLPLIQLPEGFSYMTFGWTGDVMTDGRSTPSAHDGMAVVGSKGSQIVLVRNHERTTGSLFSSAVYDPRRGGGTTNLIFDDFNGRWLQSWGSLTGTERNCAGGPTPWVSWLSCEETTRGPETDPAVDETHGWVFEVPGYGRATAQPLRDMGRFSHEAAAVDPATGYVYETEDRGASGFYRFVPNEYGRLHLGGRLQMLKVAGVNGANLTGGFANGTSWDVEWVDIADPHRAHSPGTTNGGGVYTQGLALGGATFERGEGCWYDNGRIYFVSTSGGAVGEGQVFEYDPRRERLTLIFESPSAAVMDNPDNIAVSPRGGIILCEDGNRPNQQLLGLTRDGQVFPFAENHVVLNGEINGISGNFTNREWCGATFHGRWLFVNIQTPGITFAITGPWNNGAL